MLVLTKHAPIYEPRYCTYYNHTKEDIKELLEEDEQETAKVGPSAQRDEFDTVGIELNGWMDLEGRIHKNRYEYHDANAKFLGYDGTHAMERLGWVKLQEGRWFNRDTSWKDKNTCNQAQMNAMLKWADTHGGGHEEIINDFTIEE